MIFNKRGKIFSYSRYVIAFVLVLIASGCGTADNADHNGDDTVPLVPVINYSVQHRYPHDTTLFTEGLVWHEGKLYESSGAPENFPFTKSVIGYNDLSTGIFYPKAELNKTVYFGEGIVFLGGKMYQLTYTNQKGFIYDALTFKKTGEFSYKNKEGWGLTTDGKYIIMSDGSATLTFMDPQVMQPVKTLQVTENGMKFDKLNELELIKGYLYANVWMTNYIVKIDTTTGNVVGKLDLTSIVNEARFSAPNAQELNGIAYDSTLGKVHITGKLWPFVYEIDFSR